MWINDIIYNPSHHLIITPSLMPQTASNSLNQFLWQEIKPLCFICDPSEGLSCCYCLFFNAKSSFQRTALWLRDATPRSQLCDCVMQLPAAQVSHTRTFTLSLRNEQWTNFMPDSPASLHFWSLILDCYNCFSAPRVHISTAHVVIEIWDSTHRPLAFGTNVPLTLFPSHSLT